LWITIALLTVGLGVTLILLVTRQGEERADDGAVAAPSDSPRPSTGELPKEVEARSGGPPKEVEARSGGLPKEVEARTRLLFISGALDRYFRDRYEFPDRLEVLIASDMLKPKDLDDPWGRPVDYTRVAKSRFKLCSRGPDATSYTDDDVCIGPAGREERPGRPTP